VYGSIRVATPADAGGIADIYLPAVRESAISFETRAPSAEEFHERIEKTLRAFPWFVFENGEVNGYAYAGPFRSRDAYRWSAEVSVYVREGFRRNGIGRALCEIVLDVLERQGYARALGGITLPNAGSVGLLESLGFEPAGVFERVGFKFGRWHDVGWWQRALRDPRAPEPPIPFEELRALTPTR
jgi:L-amino acid N-acyltransferase YncA